MKITPHPNLFPHHALHVKHAGEKENDSVINSSSDYKRIYWCHAAPPAKGL